MRVTLRTHFQTAERRYVVKLPFKNDPWYRKFSPYHVDVKLESRLIRRPDVEVEYNKFLSEYKTFGHIEAVLSHDKPLYPSVYIPHYPVLRDDSTITWLRVVFNASKVTSNGTLNDHLFWLAKLQNDLFFILLWWHRHRYVYAAYIEKMFQQILVHRNDIDFQRIFAAQGSAHSSLCLHTVTYCSLFIHSCTAASSPWQTAQISSCDSDPLKRDLCLRRALWLRWLCFYSRNSILTQCIIKIWRIPSSKMGF